MRKEFKEKVDRIASKIDLCNESISWWEKAVMEILDELEELRSKPTTEKSEKRDADLVDQLAKLIPRGDFELHVINKLEKEFKELIKNEKKQRKTKKKSPPKRKDI